MDVLDGSVRIERDIKSFDVALFLLVCLVGVFGIIILTSAFPQDGMKQRFLFIIGIGVLLVSAFVDYRFIYKFYIVYYLLNLGLLVIVLFIGGATNDGANVQRWIPIFGDSFTIQPSEFSKLFLILFLATYIDKQKEKINNLFVLAFILFATGLPIALVIIQPALSASLVLGAIMVSILFAANINYKYIMAVLGVGIPVSAFFYYDLRFNSLKFIMKLSGGLLKDYHFDRIISFLNKNKNDDLFMQTYNSLVAIATGNLKGKGLGNGVLNNLGFIPNRDNDFIFSAIGEELGFMGCVSVLFVMFLIIVKLFLIANRSHSNLGRLIVVGVIGMFAFQAFVNAAVATDLIVNTGMTFPFLSSGGSSMLVNMVCVGLAINVGMEKPKSMFEG